MSPEGDRRALQEILSLLKLSIGAAANSEIKLKHLSEPQFFNLLKDLSSLSGVLYAVATDSGLNQPDIIAEHKAEQAANIVKYKGKMLYQAGRDALQVLSDRVASLPHQLYVQLHCQVNLIEAIITNSILYFVQRKPRSLGVFRWRIDQKNSTKTEYETAFQQVLPAFLQTMSLRSPMPMLVGADYSAFSRFDWAPEEKPTYLREYGIEINDQVATNIGMLVRENFKFVDSKSNQGVQVADLLASGLRRCLRCEFTDNESAAQLLGRLMVQNYKGKPPIRLLGFLKNEPSVNARLGQMVQIMEENARMMLTC